MDDVTMKRLLFTKRLHLHGTIHSQNNAEIDRFIAIHHFDNSIELFLKIFATRVGIISTTKQDFNFKDLWNEVRLALEKRTPPYNLPLKDQMFTLHETRNLAQHQGDAPSHETVIKYQEYTKDFFIICFKDIFDIEYDRVYASALVKDERIKKTLVEAEQNLESNNFKESMKSSAKGFGYLKLREKDDFQSSKLSRLTIFGVIDEHDEVRFSGFHSFDRGEAQILGKISGSMKESIDKFNRLLTERARKMNDFARTLEDELAILKLGMDYKSFKFFDKVTPHAIFYFNKGEPTIIDTDAKNYTKENALFCYEFVLELALKLQSFEG